ncbi:MAG: shikimate dehydrogenase [Spirochaetaceae bacterium 4572_7]|nr:MAG: shikimate dehydrogenase [Spirochaetaceae bacterium 4572_7]
MSRLCLTLTEKTLQDCNRIILEYKESVDLIELRVDYLEPSELSKLVTFKASIPTIITYRKECDGGLYTGDESTRISTLSNAIQGGAFSFIDLEADLIAPELEIEVKKHGVRIIRSFHDFNGVPSNLSKVLLDIKRDSSEIPKAAVMINSTKDLLEFYREVLSIKNEEKIVLGMGVYGFNTRLLAEKIGSYLTFSSKDGVIAAPGHVSPEILNNTYNFRQIDKDTQIFGIIGNPVMHTKSPFIHNRGYKTLGLNAIYVPFETDNIELFLELGTILDIKGFSVTVPFKNHIIPLLGGITESVRAIGACNTVTFINGTWIGENTDYTGFIKPLIRAYGLLKGIKVTVIGAGGAAKAAIYALKNEGADILILNRTESKAKELATIFDSKYAPLNSSSRVLINEYSSVIVQTTNVGMHPLEHIDPMEFYSFKGTEYLYDIIYNPEKTLFLNRGLGLGCRVLNGWDMLLEQGYKQFKLFTGLDYPINN